MEKYIPNAEADMPTFREIRKYRSPLPKDFVFKQSDNVTTFAEVERLEQEFGFRIIEVAGSLNYLVNTVFKICFEVQKLCRYTRRPHTSFKGTSFS